MTDAARPPGPFWTPEYDAECRGEAAGSAVSRSLKHVYLHPGDLCIAHEPSRLVTVLGSCVSLTLFHPKRRIGAMCHATLPHCRTKSDCTDDCGECFKYVDCAVGHMFRTFRELGMKEHELEIKVFGGADTMASKRENTIGSQNVKATLDILGMRNLNVIAADVGDSFGRKIIFLSHTGEVYRKRLNNRS